MDYNTQRHKLTLPEYGRIVQNMIDYCCDIEDKEEQLKAANTIISLMGSMNPHFKDIADYKHKLWDHLAIMSDFKLKIDTPYPPPRKDIMTQNPERLPYSENKFKYRHHGRFIEKILKNIDKIEDEQKKQVLIERLANYMKRSYMIWKKESISDEIIFKELVLLAKGNIEIPETLKLGSFKEVLYTASHNNPKKQTKNNKNSKK